MMRTALIFIFALSVHAARAQNPDDLTGTWSASQGKHGFQAVGLPVTNLQLAFHGPALQETIKVVTGSGDRTFTLRYTTDGSETTNDFAGHQLVSRAWWQGNRLVVEWRLQGSESGLRRVFSVGEGEHGKSEMQVQEFAPTRLDMRTVILAKTP